MSRPLRHTQRRVACGGACTLRGRKWHLITLSVITLLSYNSRKILFFSVHTVAFLVRSQLGSPHSSNFLSSFLSVCARASQSKQNCRGGLGAILVLRGAESLTGLALAGWAEWPVSPRDQPVSAAPGGRASRGHGAWLTAWDLETEASGCCCSPTVWTRTTEQGLTVAWAVLPQPPKFWDGGCAPPACLEPFPAPTISAALFEPGDR